MVVSQNRGNSNIDPNILYSLLWDPQNGTPIFRKSPYGSKEDALVSRRTKIMWWKSWGGHKSPVIIFLIPTPGEKPVILYPKPLISGAYNCILKLQASTLIQHSLPGQLHSVPAVQTHFTRTSGLPAATCTARWESCVGSRVLGSQFSGLWLARNEAMDPYSNPHIAHYSNFHVLFHSFIPTLNPKQ